MSPAVAELVKAALALSEPEREELAEALSVLDERETEIPPELDAELIAELERRVAEDDAEPDDAMTLDEVIAHFRSTP